MTPTLRDAAQQALEALEGVDARCITSGYVGMDGQYLKVVVAAKAALRDALAEQPEQEPVRGEWQGYTWNPYAVSQPAIPPGYKLVPIQKLVELKASIHGDYFRGTDWELETISTMLIAAANKENTND